MGIWLPAIALLSTVFCAAAICEEQDVRPGRRSHVESSSWLVVFRDFFNTNLILCSIFASTTRSAFGLFLGPLAAARFQGVELALLSRGPRAWERHFGSGFGAAITWRICFALPGGLKDVASCRAACVWQPVCSTVTLSFAATVGVRR